MNQAVASEAGGMQASWWAIPLHRVLWAECSLTEFASRPHCLPLSGLRLGLLWAWPRPTVHLSAFSHRTPGSGAQSVFLLPGNMLSQKFTKSFSIPKCIIVSIQANSVASPSPCVQGRSRPRSRQLS